MQCHTFFLLKCGSHLFPPQLALSAWWQLSCSQFYFFLLTQSEIIFRWHLLTFAITYYHCFLFNVFQQPATCFLCPIFQTYFVLIELCDLLHSTGFSFYILAPCIVEYKEKIVFVRVWSFLLKYCCRLKLKRKSYVNSTPRRVIQLYSFFPTVSLCQV